MKAISGYLYSMSNSKPGIVIQSTNAPLVTFATEYQSKGQYKILLSKPIISNNLWYSISGVPFGRLTRYGDNELFLEVFDCTPSGLLSTDSWGQLFFELKIYP